MRAVLANVSTLAVFNLGPGEVVLILAVIVIVFVSRQFPDLARGLRLGLFHFRKAAEDIRDELDLQAFDAGKSVGGIYGKPAAEALAPGNQTAELYDPAVFRKEEQAELRAGARRQFLMRSVLYFVLTGVVVAALLVTLIRLAK